MSLRAVSIQRRHLSSTRGNFALNIGSLVQKTVSSVNVKRKEQEANEEEKKRRTKERIEAQKLLDKEKRTFTAEQLNDMYRSEYREAPTRDHKSLLNAYFYHSKVTLDWLTADFIDMPGEKERYELEQELKEDEEEGLDDIIKFDEDNEQQAVNKQEEEREVNGFVKPFLTPGLPEVVFLGKCNVGKSTLLNGLVSPLNTKELENYAFASKTAGYTKTMNAYNIGDRIRIIDTPGYGVKGRPAEGEQVLEYLQSRKELKKCYLLIGAVDGFNHYDDQILEVLNGHGIPYEVVFTKVDKLKSLKTIKTNIKKSGILNSVMNPDLLFVSSDINRRFPERQGFTELRKSIFDACGLPYNIKPFKMKENKR